MNYDTLKDRSIIEETIAHIKANGMDAVFFPNRLQALEKIKESIPPGASVMNGASRTLEEVGYIAYLQEGTHGWNNLHAAIVAEEDPAKKAVLRKQAVLSDYYLGSVHAIAETGELVFASASGSQMPHLAYTSPHLILVAGAQKIMPTLDEARMRVRDYVFPLEDARMKSTGAPGSLFAKELILHRESSMMGRSVLVIIVNEKLGF